MDNGTSEIRNARFRVRWRGYDQGEVNTQIQQLTDEIRDLKIEASTLKRTLQEQEKELKEFKDRENTIRNVLMNAHKSIEQMKTNAEKEARLTLSEAELKAEKIVEGAHRRLGQLNQDIAELKRQRIQLESRLRAVIQSYQQILDMEGNEAKDIDNEDKAGVLNKQ